MRYIDMQTWSRREHFKLYGAFDQLHFGKCANVDLAIFYPAIKQRGHSMTIASCEPCVGRCTFYIFGTPRESRIAVYVDRQIQV